MSYYKALITGVILLTLFGGILPLMLSPFATDLNDYSGYLSPIISFVENGISVKMPNIFGFSPQINLNPFSLFGNFKAFILNQIQGYSLIPPILGLPLIIITSIFLIYGIIKILPFG